MKISQNFSQADFSGRKITVISRLSTKSWCHSLSLRKFVRYLPEARKLIIIIIEIININIFIKSKNYMLAFYQEVHKPPFHEYLLSGFFLSSRLRKAGRLVCGGARKTHWATCHNEELLVKLRSFLNLPAFLDLNGIR